MKKKKTTKVKAKNPLQITLGGKVGAKAWKMFVLPLIRDAEKSTREIGEMLGVSHNTVSIWRRVYL
jgi:hypothetical protein